MMRIIDRICLWADERSTVIQFLNQFLRLSPRDFFRFGLDVKNYRAIMPDTNVIDRLEIVYMFLILDTTDNRFIITARNVLRLCKYVLLLNLNKPNALQLIDQIIMANLQVFQTQPLYIIGVTDRNDDSNSRVINTRDAFQFCAQRNIKYIENVFLSNLETLQYISLEINHLPLTTKLHHIISELFQGVMFALTLQKILGKPLSTIEAEMLCKFGTFHNRSLLELHLPLDDPIIQNITGQLSVPNANGMNVLL